MRYTLFVVMFFILGLLNSLFAEGTEPKFEHITTRNGLSQNHVNSIFQDKTGYLWVGTFNGLNRYDGYQFKLFNYFSNDETSLSQNSVNVVFQDKSGDIWVGTEQGLNKYNPADETFKRYFNLNPDGSICIENNIRTIYEDDNGVFWIGFYGGGLMRFYPKEGRFEVVPELKAFFEERKVYKINTFYADKKGYYWLGTEPGGLVQYNPLSHQIVSFTSKSAPKQRISGNTVTSIVEDADRCLWIGTWEGGINKLDLKTGEITVFKVGLSETSLPSNIITSLMFDKDGFLWVSTFGKGVAKLDTKSEIFTTYHTDPTNINSINHDVVWRVFQDREGVFWFGTYGGGLNKSILNKNNMNVYKMEPGRANWLNENYVYSFCETSSGKNLIGTFGGGVNVFDREKNSFSYLLNDSVGSAKIVRVIFEDSNKNIWVATDNALCIYSPTFQVKRYFKYNLSATGVGENTVYSIAEDKEGNFWIGSWMGGVRKLNKSELLKTNTNEIVFEPFKKERLEYLTVWNIFQDKHGDMWIGTNNSLFRYLSESKEFVEVTQELLNDDMRKNITVSSFYEDVKRNKLWFGTLGNGVGCYDYSSKTFSFISSKDGLSHDEVFAVYSDGSDNIWISSSNGLSQYNQSSKVFRNFDIATSNSPNELLSKSWLLSTGEILVAGNSGFYIFNPLNVYADVFVSPVVITDFRIFNQSVYRMPQVKNILAGDINSLDNITLNQDFNVFSFQFSVLDFRNPSQNEFKYMLEGYDKDWSNSGVANRVATYTNLDAGKYVLKYKGCNSDGIWSAAAKEITINIVPPFYKTWYFRLIVIALVLGLLFYLFLLKFKTLTERVKAKIVDINFKKIEEENSHLAEINLELECDLDEKSKELATLRLFIQKREDNLKDVKSIVAESLAENGLLPKSKSNEIINLLNQEMKEKNSWDAFKENIDVLQHDFIKNLANQYPRLTQKDLIVCAYIKMAKSNKDIANHLNISNQSVEMTRYRIRKKIELNSRISLNDFLARL